MRRRHRYGHVRNRLTARRIISISAMILAEVVVVFKVASTWFS